MQVAFFDLDGCLVDSTEPIAEAFNAGLRGVGADELPPHDIHPYIGPPLVFSFAAALEQVGANPDRAADAVQAYRAAYPKLAVSGTRVVPGIRDALVELSRDMRLDVVTSKPVEFADPILQAVGLRDLFEAVYGPALDALTEPKEVQLRRALEVVGIGEELRRAEACMVGDRRHDMQAGATCGTATIGVTWGIGTRVELAMAGADVIVDDPADLVAAFESLQ